MKPLVGLRWTLSIGLSLALVSTAAAAEKVVFQVPAGWVDLSPGAPEGNFTRVAPAIAERAKQLKLPFFAASPEPSPDAPWGFGRMTGQKPERVTASYVDEVAAGIAKGFAQQPERKFLLVSKRVLKAGGVSVGEIVSEASTNDGRRIVQLFYMLPVPGDVAVVTFTTVMKRLEADRAVVEKAVLATRGLVQPR